MMRIPLPAIPEWWSRLLDRLNDDIGPTLLWYRPRWIDIAFALILPAAIIIDAAYFQGWQAWIIDPPTMLFGWLTTMYFVRGVDVD